MWKNPSMKLVFSGSAVGGGGARDKASATIFSSPMMCRISVVNSEINDNWRSTRGDFSVFEVKAEVSSFWSVYTGKCLPST